MYPHRSVSAVRLDQCIRVASRARTEGGMIPPLAPSRRTSEWASKDTQPRQWETPGHREVDPFDRDYDDAMVQMKDPLSLVPSELKAKANWVRWKLETVNGRLT